MMTINNNNKKKMTEASGLVCLLLAMALHFSLAILADEM